MDNFAEMLMTIALMDGGKNKGASVPIDDAVDAQKGATHIPGEVTDARRRDERVVFNTIGDKSDWFWTLPDGTRLNHG